MKPRLAELIKPKVTFKDIAQAYGCHPSFVSQVASGHRKAPVRFKLLVSEMLRLPVSVIFPGQEVENDAKTSND